MLRIHLSGFPHPPLDPDLPDLRVSSSLHQAGVRIASVEDYCPNAWSKRQNRLEFVSKPFVPAGNIATRNCVERYILNREATGFNHSKCLAHRSKNRV